MLSYKSAIGVVGSANAVTSVFVCLPGLPLLWSVQSGYLNKTGVKQSRDQRRYSGLAGSHAAPNSQAQ